VNATSAGDVLVVLDDTSAAAGVLEMSSVLAQLERRALRIVYVESAAALQASTLPFTRVLAHAGSTWEPLEPQDVERGWRAHAARLRQLAAHASSSRAVHWSMDVRRGALNETALALSADSDRMLVGSASTSFTLVGKRPQRTVIAAVDVGGANGEQVVRTATALARALGARLQLRPIDRARPQDVRLDDADLVVLPSAALTRHLVATLRVPMLLVSGDRSGRDARPVHHEGD